MENKHLEFWRENIGIIEQHVLDTYAGEQLS